MTEYEIRYSIQTRDNEDDDWTEIGFGTSGASAYVGEAAYAISTDITRREWETSPGMPDPKTVDRDSDDG